MPAEADAFGHAVEPALGCIGLRHIVGAERSDEQEKVLAVAVCQIIGPAMHVFSGNRQVTETTKHVAADLGQFSRIIAADVEDGDVLVGREGVEAQREHRNFARGSGSFVVTARVGVEPGRGRGVDVADMVGIGAVRGPQVAVAAHILGPVSLAVEARQDFFRVAAEFDAEMIDEVQASDGVHLGKKGHLRKGRSPAHQGATGIVAHAAGDGSADAGGPDDRVRLAADCAQTFLQLVQRGAGQADHLLPCPEQIDAIDPQRVDDDDGPIVALTGRCRAAGETRIRRLADNNDVVRNARLEDAPLLQKGAGPHHSKYPALAKTVPLAVAPRLSVTDEYVAFADHVLHSFEQGVHLDPEG